MDREKELETQIFAIADKIDALQDELNGLYEEKIHDIPWAPGVTDQFENEFWVEKICKDPAREKEIKEEIERLENEKKPLVDEINVLISERWERERQARMPKTYEYVKNGETKVTTDRVLAAKMNAQHRYSKLGKLQKALAVITGQKKKFDTIIKEMAHKSEEEKIAYAEQLEGMYGGSIGK